MKKLLAVLGLTLVLPFLAQAAGPDVGQPDDIKFTSVSGKKVDLAQLRGKVVLVDYWETWCPP